MAASLKIDFQWKSENLLNRDNEYTITVEKSGNDVGFQNFLNNCDTSFATPGYQFEAAQDKEFLACIKAGKTVRTYSEKDAKELYRRMQTLGALKAVLDRDNEVDDDGNTPFFDVTLMIKGVPTIGLVENALGYGGASKEEKKQQDEQVVQAYGEAAKAAVNKAKEVAGEVGKAATSWVVPLIIVFIIILSGKKAVGL